MSVIVDKALYSELPSDAVPISRQDAVELQWKMIYDWKPTSDVWPYRYGIGALSLACGISALSIASHYRKKLKLLHYGRVSMYFPIVLIPSVLLPFAHMKLVSEEILLKPSCPVCLQVRAMTLQSIAGVAYPMVLAPISGFMYCTVFATYRLPLLRLENLREIYQLWLQFTRPLSSKLILLWAIHIGLAATVTHLEAKSLFRVQAKILKDNEYSYNSN